MKVQLLLDGKYIGDVDLHRLPYLGNRIVSDEGGKIYVIRGVESEEGSMPKVKICEEVKINN